MSLRKTKEIGIRKVFGANISQIVMLFSKEFLLLVISALVVAGPIGYYFMNIWLEDYAYKVEISWDYFLFLPCRVFYSESSKYPALLNAPQLQSQVDLR